MEEQLYYLVNARLNVIREAKGEDLFRNDLRTLDDWVREFKGECCEANWWKEQDV